MAAPTLTATQQGLYEQPLTANTPLTVNIQARYAWESTMLEVINHGTALTYMQAGTTCQLKDPNATLIAPGGWSLIYCSSVNSITLISATDTTISINRR